MDNRLGFSMILTAALTLTACGGGNGTTGPGGSGGAGGNNGGTGGTGGVGGGTGGTGGNTGGTGTGATGGTGGTGATGGTGGSSAMPECTDASQCVLVNDCCSCLGIGSGDPTPACNIPECFAPTCTAQGLEGSTAQCVAGQCVAGFECDHNLAACNSLPPDCPPGQTATINGLCWGSCVPAGECVSVGSCDQCDGGLGCAKEITQVGVKIHCVAVPSSCNGKPSCECMGAAVCVEPYDTCSEDPTGALSCSCPNC